MVSNTQKRSVLKLPVFKEQTAGFNYTSSKAVGIFGLTNDTLTHEKQKKT
jgi:hypothetical protein